MKQSTKLLSFLLAILMAFSCMSVIGSAALDKKTIAYDGIDDADLTYNQVATLALDLVDNDLLADMDTIDLSIVGELRLNKIDYILADIKELRSGFVWSIGKGLLGDVGDLNFKGLTVNPDNDGAALQRSNGDYAVISGLLRFLSDNAGILSKAAYGLSGGDGISLGLISSFLDLGEVGTMLNDIPSMLVGLVYDLLIYGSYGYDKDIDDIKEAKSTLSATYPEMDTLNEMVPNAIYNLLTKPQDYTWEGEGKDAVKVWDMDSVIMPGLTLTKEDINPLSKSFFQILDNAAQVAIDEIGVPALNNNLKKALMLAVEADLNKIDYSVLPAAVKTAFDDTASYVNYFAYDRLMKDGGVWYYTTLETTVVTDKTTGEPELDEEGNEITEKTRMYYKVNFGSANEFASLINWDWNFVGSDVSADVAAANGWTRLIYDEVKVDGVFVAGLNGILGMVYDVALTDAAKADFLAKAQLIDPDYTGWKNENGNEDLMVNVEYLTKYILTQFGDRIFGSTSKYANYAWEDVQDLTIIDIVAMIGPEFFEDAMPQIILPKKADGTYAFHEGVQLWEFAAIVLRELMTGIAPIVNYDSVIFAAGNVASADDRLLAEHDVDEWFNIILNMGTDLGLVYLQQLTNFADFCGEVFDDEDLDARIKTGGGTDAEHWTTNLNAAILWAIDYIGSTRNSAVIAGLDYAKLTSADLADPIDKLSYILNTILPLGFIGDGSYTSDEYDLDLNLVVDAFKELLTGFDLNLVLKLLGRNQESDYNLLDDASLGTAVLDLVNDLLNLIFGKTILQGVNATTSVSAQSLDNVISKASLKTTVNNLLTGLNGRKDAILMNALPVVGKLIKGWGTEQRFKNPVNNLGTFVNVEDTGCSYWYETKEDCKGNKSYTIQDKDPISFTIRNGSDGMWRHYIDPATGTGKQDEQYKFQLASINFYNYNGSASSYIHTINFDSTNKIDYGGSTTVSFKVGSIKTPDNQTRGSGSAVPAEGVVQKVKIGYKIFVEDGSALLNGKVFYTEFYTWLSRYANDEMKNYEASSKSYEAHVFSPAYIPYNEEDPQVTLDEIKNLGNGEFWREKVTAGSAQDHKIEVQSSPDTDGFTLSAVSASLKNEDIQSVRIRLFDTYTAKVLKSDGSQSSTFNVSGKVPTVETFVKNVTPTEVNSEAGASSSWTVGLRTKNDDLDGAPVVLKYYNAEYRDLLIDLVNSENNAQRKAADYKHSYGVTTVEASEALNNVDIPASESESGEFELRETNFPVGSNGVTVIDTAQAWTNYYNALEKALRGGLQEWNPKSVFNFRALYEELRVAVNDIEYCQATADDGAATLGTAIDALEDQLRATQSRTTDKFNHTDYKMYRHNRFNDARNSANGYITLKDDAAPANVTYIDEYFDYSWMEENDFRELVGSHTVKYGDKAGTTVAANKYQTYLLALLEKFEEEEIESKKTWLNDRKKEYANLSELDLAMAANYLTLTENRLLKRDNGVEYAQLNDEITSAQNMIGTANNGRYTETSWKNFKDAYDDAVAAQSCGSQKQVFDAKYQLCVQRKNLVLVDDEADYTELEALIEYAEFAINNTKYYNNSNKEFGQVLAELGMDPIVNTDGYEVQLFPGSAYLTVDRGYGIDDQEKVDDAAIALKEALARLKFKGLEVTEVPTDTLVGSEVLVEGNEEEKIEEISALVSHLPKCKTEDYAKTFFSVKATDLNVSEVVVSNDVNYALGLEEFKGLVGTNSTVTFYTTIGSVKLPVATVKVIVDGDINGDGAIDVLDAMYGALVAAEKGELEGCYLLAGDLSGNDREIGAQDYQAIVTEMLKD